MVAARETKLHELLEGAKQYQVPLYQRTYSWADSQLRRLWDDVVQLAQDRAEDPELTHFIGSVVLTPSPMNGPTGVQEFLVIDGQQRLTTLTILLCALRDHRAANEDAEHRARIDEQYLINKWKPEQERLKLVPTQTDRSAYEACLSVAPQAGGAGRIGAAYRFFKSKLAAADDVDDPTDIEWIEQAVISGLALVSVTTQEGDNPHRIFESLNNTGLKLTQGDLLRNYLFMRLPTRRDAVYKTLWEPLQKSLESSDLELLFWLDMVQRDPRVKQTDTYSVQQRRLDRLRTEEEIEQEVARFGQLGNLLRTILDPAREADSEVRRRLERLAVWGTTTVYPLLLHLLDRREQGSADSKQIATAMLYVESFFVRRLLIGRATAGVNRHLLSVVTEMDKMLPVDEAVHRFLSTGRKYYASDANIRSSARTIPYYLYGRPHQRTLVLRWLEESYESKEPVELENLTIEHVLPQTLTPQWREMLDADLAEEEDLDETYESLVHTLGNLTLTGYNSALSNSPFAVKRDKLATSGVWMNQEIAGTERWGRTQILERADGLAERIIKEWPGPGDSNQDRLGVAWDTMSTALASLPAGAWTAYGDLAALIGSSPIAVGKRLGITPAPNAHRVLQSGGSVSKDFAWLDSGRTDNPKEVLEAEGVTFNESGKASQSQRISTKELATLLGTDIDELVPEPDPGQAPELRDRFVQQLRERQGDEITSAVLMVLNAWTEMGAVLSYGVAASETSCFLLSRTDDDPEGKIWPAAIYPSGKFEVVFQHLRGRSPFDDDSLRDELRKRLNKIDGVDLPAVKLDFRPGFALALLLRPDARDVLFDVLEWFHRTARSEEALPLPS